MTLKELTGLAEVVRGMNFTDGILGIEIMQKEFPRIQLTEEEYVMHFGNTLLMPHSEKYDQRKIRWSGCEFFCLVPEK
jgi:hypothetical protein